jgi:hypothetical protein
MIRIVCRVNSSTEAQIKGVRQWLYIIAGVLFFGSFFCTSKRKNIKTFRIDAILFHQRVIISLVMKPCFHFIKKICTAVLLTANRAASAQKKTAKNNTERLQLADEIERSIRTELLNKWYPKAWIVYMVGF